MYFREEKFSANYIHSTKEKIIGGPWIWVAVNGGSRIRR
jgi:hypothetical protein